MRNLFVPPPSILIPLVSLRAQFWAFCVIHSVAFKSSFTRIKKVEAGSHILGIVIKHVINVGLSFLKPALSVDLNEPPKPAMIHDTQRRCPAGL